jgi:nucleolar protein 16
MAGSLRRKKRAKAASGKKTQKVGVATNFQTGRTRVDHAAVNLPGAPRATEPWNVDATLTRNYAASGLASDANVAGRGGRNANDAPGTAVKDAVATLATSDGDETRALLGQTKSSGFAAPKRLTPKQTRVVETLVRAHGDDLNAMVMDRKRNAMQHSSGTLLRMTESYHYWREEATAAAGTVRVDFRAPKKSKLRGRV